LGFIPDLDQHAKAAAMRAIARVRGTYALAKR
jgi:hypothetical protein